MKRHVINILSCRDLTRRQRRDGERQGERNILSVRWKEGNNPTSMGSVISFQFTSLHISRHPSSQPLQKTRRHPTFFRRASSKTRSRPSTIDQIPKPPHPVNKRVENTTPSRISSPDQSINQSIKARPQEQSCPRAQSYSHHSHSQHQTPHLLHSHHHPHFHHFRRRQNRHRRRR
jgi:hypothetical protein